MYRGLLSTGMPWGTNWGHCTEIKSNHTLVFRRREVWYTPLRKTSQYRDVLRGLRVLRDVQGSSQYRDAMGN